MKVIKSRKGVQIVATYIVLTIALFITLFPFMWMVFSSLKPSNELFSLEPKLLPSTITMDNYIKVLNHTDFTKFFLNSFKVTTIATLFSVLISIYAAYSLSRFKFPGSNAYGIVLLLLQTFPPVLLVISLFLIFQRIGLFNTHAALILSYVSFTIPFCIWMLRGYFDAIPKELEEAARIDGASMLTTLHRIILPISGPGIAAVAIYAFIRAWQEFLFALVLLQSSSLRTLPLGLAALTQEFSFRWDLLMSSATLATVPILFFFVFMQKFIVQGLTAGAVKG